MGKCNILVNVFRDILGYIRIDLEATDVEICLCLCLCLIFSWGGGVLWLTNDLQILRTGLEPRQILAEHRKI